MSLLLDALKKTGTARPDAVQQTSSNPNGLELTLESLPEKPQQKIARKTDDDPARLAAHNLFAAKHARGRAWPGIVPLALFGGILLASAGSYYVWREISAAPMLKRMDAAPAAVDAAVQPPATAPALLALAPEAAATPAEIAAATRPAAAEKSAPARRAPAVAVASPQAVAPDAVPPIRIEHGKEDDSASDPILLAGYRAYRNGDLDAARRYYSVALQQDDQNRDALLGLAAIAQQQSQDDIAAFYYRQVLALDPRDPVAQAGMAMLTGTADAAGAESRLKLLLMQYPQSAALYFALGNLYAGQARWGEAQQAYFEAVRRDPEDGYFAFNLAVSLDHLGQKKLAAQQYQRALQLSPSATTGFDRAQVQQRAIELAMP